MSLPLTDVIGDCEGELYKVWGITYSPDVFHCGRDLAIPATNLFLSIGAFLYKISWRG